jgi:alpha/beta superfamily hydrolase
MSEKFIHIQAAGWVAASPRAAGVLTRRAMAKHRFRSSAGWLEAIHDAPQGDHPPGAFRAAVVCHPHPLHGGTMDNKVVFTLARSLRERGLHVLRFNFRGAGGSEGVHDEGRGEREDVRAALDEVQQLASASEGGPGPGGILLAGFSFGSFVGLTEAWEDERVGGLIAVAPPVNHYTYPLVESARVPLAVIYAADDELVPAESVEAWSEAAPQRVRVEGATHLFHGHLRELREGVDAFLDAYGLHSRP